MVRNEMEELDTSSRGAVNVRDARPASRRRSKVIDYKHAVSLGMYGNRYVSRIDEVPK